MVSCHILSFFHLKAVNKNILGVPAIYTHSGHGQNLPNGLSFVEPYFY